jgi:F0F1-type ATP synthase alpha subunit
VIDYINLSGGQAERISNTGRYIDESRIVTDVLGNRKKIGSGKYIKGTGTNGTADISATFKGKSIKIEIKMKDKQSEVQKEYQQAIERAGGIYFICHNFEEFLDKFNTFV